MSPPLSLTIAAALPPAASPLRSVLNGTVAGLNAKVAELWSTAAVLLSRAAHQSRGAAAVFQPGQIVSEVVICHSGLGSAACSLKVIAAITKGPSSPVYWV